MKRTHYVTERIGSVGSHYFDIVRFVATGSRTSLHNLTTKHVPKKRTGKTVSQSQKHIVYFTLADFHYCCWTYPSGPGEILTVLALGQSPRLAFLLLRRIMSPISLLFSFLGNLE